MKKLYRYNLYCGRMGSIDSVFVADDEEMKKALGKRIYFGEVLGKHSEIVDEEFSESSLEVLSEEQSVCDIIEEHIGSTGHCPLNYIDEDEDEDGEP